MKSTVILLAGKKGVGKSTAAGFFLDKLGNRTYRAEKFSFADALKRMVMHIGIPYALSTGSFDDKSKPTHYKWEELSEFLRSKYPNKSGAMTVRDVLQVFGSDVVRDCFCPDIWVKCLMSEIKSVIKDYEARPGWQFLDEYYAIIDDCRMKNEVQNHEGFDRTIKIKIVRPSLGSADSHQSEIGLDSIPDIMWDYILINDGSIEEYYSKLSKLLGEIYRE